MSISGDGFGEEPLSVRFSRRGGGAPIDVAPITHTDRVVTVEVPAGAGAGPVSLVREIPVVIYSRVEYATFIVASTWIALQVGPEVVLLAANGASNNAVAEPGASVHIEWECAGTDSAQLRITASGTDLLRRAVDAAGSLRSTLPSDPEAQRLEVEVSGSGPCPPHTVRRTMTLWVERPYRLRVDGLEVTQAIQHYRAPLHLMDSSDWGPDNSIPMVAFKPAMLRVYVRSGLDPASGPGRLTNVRGRLRLTRFSYGRTTRLPERSQVNTAPVTAFAAPPYTMERRTIGSTVNFVIPGSEMFGRSLPRLRCGPTTPTPGLVGPKGASPSSAARSAPCNSPGSLFGTTVRGRRARRR